MTLRRQTPEELRAWRERSKKLGRGKGLKRTSKKRRAALSDPERDEVRARVFARDGGCVMAAAGWRPPCFGRLTPHHLRKAVHGGPFTEENLVAACARHNDLVEDYPAEARERGWVR